MKFFRVSYGPISNHDFETLKQAVSFARTNSLFSHGKIIKISSHTDSNGAIHWKRKILKEF